ncbi:hypothetical protein PGIGA_G00260590 [Pangasianodon gigas]|uniref:Uncharacterized protein n=1 Tax=Pangasianodon gigas TaxID=30993 RepID=A0ACC5WTE8_PANGG|nr:hypothetical protein [Pangasianodon gigas]
MGELYKALQGMELGKAPGMDGLPVDFYKSFWSELGEDLLKVLNDSLGGGLLPLSCRRAVLTLLPKKGDLTDIKCWRPVSLLCSDYKLLSKVLANRLAEVMDQVIHPDQTYCVPGRAPVEIGLLLVEEVEEGGECTDREKRKGKSVGLRIGTLNVDTMTGKGRELADMMERRKVDILCVQETRWKGSKARSIGAGFKLFYYGVNSKRNGVGVVLKEEFVEVKSVSDRVMSLMLEIEGVMLNVVSGYAPQVGCELEEKERFWSELDEVIESIPTGERVVIGADFNEHVGEGNTGDEEVMGKFGVKERNLEGQMVVDFAKRMDMAVVNTYFQKREKHRVTYKSGGRSTQVDYILCRRGNLKEISDCKVVVGESVAREHRMVVCRMTLMVCKKKRSKIEIEKKTKWWKLKKEECCEDIRQKLRQALGGQVVLPDDWETTAEVIRVTGRQNDGGKEIRLTRTQLCVHEE